MVRPSFASVVYALTHDLTRTGAAKMADSYKVQADIGSRLESKLEHMASEVHDVHVKVKMHGLLYMYIMFDIQAVFF